jgi:hypothetical protein
MRVNFPSSSDSMQIWKLVLPLHDLLGSLVSITFWAVLIDRLVTNTYPLFVTTCCWRMRRRRGTWYWNWLHICLLQQDSKVFPAKYAKYCKTAFAQ